MPEDMKREALEQAVRRALLELGYRIEDAAPAGEEQIAGEPEDITGPAARGACLLERAAQPETLSRMRQKTTARIGVGRAGARLKTRTLLTMRADHAAARDAVFLDVEAGLVERLKLFSVQSRCRNKDEYLTRPDLGRLLDEASAKTVLERCKKSPDIQILASDGLSSRAVSANLPDILPAILGGLAGREVSVGTPFYVRFGRVGVMDHVSELLGAKVTCVLLGERPGLATAESMSAYVAYNARVGMEESRRTVVSNIHRAGIPAVEAGAYLAELLVDILRARVSGVELRERRKQP